MNLCLNAISIALVGGVIFLKSFLVTESLGRGGPSSGSGTSKAMAWDLTMCSHGVKHFCKIWKSAFYHNFIYSLSYYTIVFPGLVAHPLLSYGFSVAQAQERCREDMNLFSLGLVVCSHFCR